MQLVNYPVKCSCGETTILQVNLFNGQHEILKKPGPGSGPIMAIVGHYKKLKRYDTIPTWDKDYRPRACAVAKKILHFFRKLEDPVGVAMECMNDLSLKAEREGWYWTLETVVKRAPDWIVEKSK